MLTAHIDLMNSVSGLTTLLIVEDFKRNDWCALPANATVYHLYHKAEGYHQKPGPA